MYKINRYLYISKGTHSKHEIFARNEAFADELGYRTGILGCSIAE